jgi:hypothetical protein
MKNNNTYQDLVLAEKRARHQILLLALARPVPSGVMGEVGRERLLAESNLLALDVAQGELLSGGLRK